MEVGIGLLARGDGPEKDYSVAAGLEMGGNGFGSVFENAHDAQDRCGIDCLAAGFVIERHITAGDGCAQGRAGFRDAVDGGGKLGHDFRLFRVAEVEAICGGNWSSSGGGNFAGRLGHSVHGAEFGVDIGPAAIAVQGHGQAALMARGACALDAHDSGFAARPLHGVGLDHGVVLLVDPALGADIGAGQKVLEVRREVAVLFQLGEDLFRGLGRDGGIPCADRSVIKRRIVGERLVGNVGDQNAVMAYTEARLRLDGADDYSVEAPLLEDVEDFVLAALGGHQQHPLLAFRKHDLVGGHAGLALRHEVELHVEANAAAGAHFAGGASEASRPHILDANDRAGLHGLETSFKQELFHEGVADLDIGALRLGALAELFAGHGGAVDAVSASLRAYVNYGVAGAGGLAIKNLVIY